MLLCCEGCVDVWLGIVEVGYLCCMVVVVGCERWLQVQVFRYGYFYDEVVYFVQQVCGKGCVFVQLYFFGQGLSDFCYIQVVVLEVYYVDVRYLLEGIVYGCGLYQLLYCGYVEYGCGCFDGCYVFVFCVVVC